MNAAERSSFIRELRALAGTAAAREHYRRLAVDVLTDARLEQVDPGYRELDADEQGAYLADCADTLGPALLQAAVKWVVSDMPFVTDWRRCYHAADTAPR